MELVVFDLDGTLLNRASQISPLTRRALQQLARRGIAYTVATGRTLHASRDVLHGQGFTLPHIYKNGVMIWHPARSQYSHTSLLTLGELRHVLQAVLAQGIAPFIFTIEPGNRHAIYHPPLLSDIERRLAEDFASRGEVEVLPVAQMPADADITNISALGEPAAIDAVGAMVADEPALIAYAGTALEGARFKWIDIHHGQASKGNAVAILRDELGARRVLCFGDSENDLSMFAAADESYAPDNAKPAVLAAATAVIGHHDEDGVARFLIERFGLESG